MEVKRAYPVFIKQDTQDPSGHDYLVYAPDWDAATEGDSFEDAIEMARDLIGTMWSTYLEDRKEVPWPSDQEQAIRITKRQADDDSFEFSSGILTFVDVDVRSFNSKLMNRAVKKNCTIPYWLNKEAEERGLNFSRILQEALIEACTD